MLVVISIVGALAIPFGDPQFLDRAIALELSFITLAIVILLDNRRAVKKISFGKVALYACIPLAIIVIVGNSLAPPHIEIMKTFSKPLNALLLIIGGYILQAALVCTSILELAGKNCIVIFQKQKN
ncbi:MAG TPA: hypothetical protein VG098_06795 [Nitrososphaera sp.]|nr:hypothetical protein [Nitrososphaera sp.]